MTDNPEYIPFFEYFNRDKDLKHINRDCFLFIASLKKKTIHTKFSNQIKQNKEFPPKTINSIAHRKTEGIWRKSPYHKTSFG